MSKTVKGINPKSVFVRVQLCYVVGKRKIRGKEREVAYIRTKTKKAFRTELAAWGAFRALRDSLMGIK